MLKPEFKNRVDSLVTSLVELHEQSDYLKQNLMREEQGLPDYFKTLEYRAEQFEFKQIAKNISSCLKSNRQVDVEPKYSQSIPTEITDCIAIEQRDPTFMVERGFNSKSFQRQKKTMFLLNLLVTFSFFMCLTGGAIFGFKEGKGLTEKAILIGLGGLAGGAVGVMVASGLAVGVTAFEDSIPNTFLIKDKKEIKLPCLRAAFQELKELQLAPEIKVEIDKKEKKALCISLNCCYTKEFEDSL